MPNIKVSGVAVNHVQALSKELSIGLSKTIDCPEDWITFMYGNECVFSSGEVLQDTIFVYVDWFDRGQEVKDRVAIILSDALMQLEKIVTVNVIFNDMKKTDFFENGNHY